MDYNELGLKMGLEIHQQLNSEHKLFCPCKTELVDDIYEGKYVNIPVTAYSDFIENCDVARKIFEFLFDEEGKPIKRDYSDFKIGLCVPGKLRPERIRAGVLLVETTYEMR